jgi:hypothetical protein
MTGLVLAKPKRRGWPQIAPAVLVLCAAAVTFVDKPSFAQLGPAELPLTFSNARLDVTHWESIINPQKQFVMNIYLANNGESDALRWGFEGFGLAGVVPDKNYANALFRKLDYSVQGVSTEPVMHAGQFDRSVSMLVSIPGVPPVPQWDDATIHSYKDGKFPVSILMVLAYSDDKIPAKKTIYTERCIYLVHDAIYNCSAHNREFIGNEFMWNESIEN